MAEDITSGFDPSWCEVLTGNPGKDAQIPLNAVRENHNDSTIFATDSSYHKGSRREPMLLRPNVMNTTLNPRTKADRGKMSQA